jgi:hypothetical protein
MKRALIINKSFKIIFEWRPDYCVQNVDTRKNTRHMKNTRPYANFVQKYGILHKTPIKANIHIRTEK